MSAPALVTGAHRFPSDLARPDMVAVAAPDRATLALAYDAIDASWDLAPQPAEADLESFLRSHPVEVLGSEGAVHEAQGDVECALAGAELRLEATYTTAYIAHASLETRVALAQRDDERVTVWTGTQQPFYVRYELAAALGIEEKQVRVLLDRPDIPSSGAGETPLIAIAIANAVHAACGARIRSLPLLRDGRLAL